MPTSQKFSVNKDFKNSQGGFTGILLIVGFFAILILLVMVIFLGKEALVQINRLQNKSVKVEAQSALVFISTTPTPPPAGEPTPAEIWKTYTNSNYNFELTYPKLGVIVGEEGHTEGECGSAVKEEQGRILVDSFFDIKIISWQDTIDDYLKQKGALNAYNFETILDSGADEGVEVLGLKSDVSYAVGYPPLRFITHIFKKGDKLFLVEDFHNSEYFGGCLNPRTLDPIQYAHIVKLEWDLKNSFKFL